MNLAIKDIRHNLGRFALTCVGIGMLLMIVMGMGGIYRGIVEDATLLIDRVGADLWIVQRSTRGPFAEVSRVPANLVHRALAVPGVDRAREFVYHTIQRARDGQPLRISVLGLSWPMDKGQWLPLTAGRPLGQAHFEMIADESLGLALGEQIVLGKDAYTVVGTTNSMISSSGDGIGFFTVADSQAIQFDVPGEAVRLERAARESRGRRNEIGLKQPQLLENAVRPAAELPQIARPQISAVMVSLLPATDAEQVANIISGWGDVSVFTKNGQRELLLQGSVEKVRRQIGLFRTLLTIIAAIIMALILYTLTLDKIHSIALLKLIGAPNTVILGLIMQQALMLGAIGFGIAYLLGQRVFPNFPRRVILAESDLIQLAGIVLVISVGSSILGIWKAMQVSPNEAVVTENEHTSLAIQADGLTKIYGSGNTEVVAMRDATMEVKRGEVVALLGPSGSGKSTFLTAVGLINPPTSGRISIRGQLVLAGEQSHANLRSFRRRHIGFIFQKSNLIPFLSAVENVQIAMELNGETSRAARRRALELMDYLGVSDRADNLPSMLSGGQQQRVAVARALANRPSVILADEPTAALDSQRGRQVMELFAKVAHEQGTGVIVVTHDQRALDVFDTIYEMEDGKMGRQSGSKDTLFSVRETDRELSKKESTMSQPDINTTVGTWVAQHPETSRVFESLKIDYCCGGDKSLEHACREKQLDPQQVFAELAEVIHSSDDQASYVWLNAPLIELCDHIEETHHAYLRRELPRLTDMIAKVVNAHGASHPGLENVNRVFGKLRAELEPHMSKEEQVLFPAIRQLERSSDTPVFPFGTVSNPIRMMEQEHDTAGGALAELRELTDDYTAPDDACNTYRAMLDGLKQLETDMHQHIHKENSILFPRSIKLEESRVRG